MACSRCMPAMTPGFPSCCRPSSLTMPSLGRSSNASISLLRISRSSWAGRRGGTMSPFRIDYDLLNRFEAGLDPRHPERGDVPGRVIGYGEISTVLEISTADKNNLAYKRVPIFRSGEEVERYEALYKD